MAAQSSESAEIDPIFPPELERYIFELAAGDDIGMALELTLVSKRLQLWMESIIYYTVTLSSINVCSLFLRAVDSRPASFFATNVKSLCIPGDIPLKDAMRIITVCQGVVNLAYWIDHAQPPPPFSYLSSLQPERLSMNIHGLCGSTDHIVDFHHPFFAMVTHLEIVDWSFSLSGYEHLPCLTHLAVDIDQYSSVLVERLQHILESCPQLRVLLCLMSDEDMAFDAAEALSRENDADCRLLVMFDFDPISQWQVRQWNFADAVVAANRNSRQLS
ncbi:hypothetical protein Hypma_003561 [Hypsizygus marmoreus]|uniref:F-box domain-containing protein n=1 Tax=Hypsizygus marmoreus TaxID=39966 RepID=A0A369J672_HYPMA|nr:hypothetical protein Hypma_003561 [Hypsizygus marmoreus]